MSIHRRKPVVKGREKQQPQSGLTKGKKQMISRISSTPSGLSNLSLALPHVSRVDSQISLRWSELKLVLKNLEAIECCFRVKSVKSENCEAVKCEYPQAQACGKKVEKSSNRKVI